MLHITRYAVRRRRNGTLVLSALLGLLAAATVGFFPSISASGVDFEAYLESLPPAFREAFGVAGLTTIEGFLATEFYQFAFVILLGMYAAYTGGRLIAAEVETGRVDLVLAGPTSRNSVVVERYLSLLPTFLLVNLVTMLAVLGAVEAIGESIALERLLVTHLLSLPYLLCCGAIGLLLSVLVNRADTAQRAGLGLIFGLLLVESLSAATDYDWVGYVSPTAHYDPSAILVNGQYDWTGAGVLLAASVVLVAVAVWWFGGHDVDA
jgi:ABC-2 type transport system permease protein